MDEATLEVAADVGPLRGEDAIDDRVAHSAVGTGVVMPDHAVLPGAQRLDGPLGAEVEVVGLEPATASRPIGKAPHGANTIGSDGSLKFTSVVLVPDGVTR